MKSLNEQLKNTVTSLSTSYSYMTRQANTTKNELQQFSKSDISLASKSIHNSTGSQVWSDDYMIFRGVNEGGYTDAQFKIVNGNMYVTRDNWQTSKIVDLYALALLV